MVPIVLGACLGGKGESDIFTAWFSNDHLLLLNSVGSINKLGNIEALVFNLILTLNLSDLNCLGDTDLLGSRVGKGAGNLQRNGNKRNFVCLSLVFLTAHLVFSMSISRRSVSSSSASRHLHCLRFLLISNLGGSTRSCHIFPLILISTDLSVYGSRGLLANGEDTVKAVVIINDLLDCKSDRSHLLSKGRHAHLSVDGSVGVPAVELRSIPIAWRGSRGEGDD